MKRQAREYYLSLRSSEQGVLEEFVRLFLDDLKNASFAVDENGMVGEWLAAAVQEEER